MMDLLEIIAVIIASATIGFIVFLFLLAGAA